jgi:hypothetical protein
MEDQYDTILAAIASGRGRTILVGALAEHFALELGVRWEGFVHDLFVAYLMQGKRAFLRSKNLNIMRSVGDRYGDGWLKLVRVRNPLKWTPRLVEALIDPNQRNIVVTSADDLYHRATQLLGSRAIKFSLNPDDRQLVNFVVALRNYLAHRSKASRKDLYQAAAAFISQGPNAELFGRLRQVSTYLRTGVKVGKTPRIKVVHARLSEIAGKLV